MSDRPSQRRRRGYGRSAQRSTSTSSLSSDATKRKKFALQERQFFSVDSTDDEFNVGSLESTEYSGSSSLSSIDFVKSRSGSRDFFRRVNSDIDKSTRNRRRPGYSVYDFEAENIHPNVIFNESNSIDSLLPPSKNKKLRHAPTQRQKSYESEALLAMSPPNLRKRKIIRSKSLTLDIHRSPEPLTRSSSLKCQSGRHSPAFSNASSVSSFSSIAKTGVPGWQKSFLERASENLANKENSSANEAHYSDYDTVDTSTTPCPNNELKPDILSPPSFSGSIAFPSNLQSPSTPERSSQNERRDSSRKRGVCESPSVSLEDMNFSFPSTHRLARVRDTSLSRSSRSRSRMFQQNNETDSSDISSIFKSQETKQKKPTNLYEMRSSKSVESDNEEDSNVGERSDDDMKHISASSSGDLSFTNPSEQSSEIQSKPPEDMDASPFNSKICQLISPRGHQQMKRVNIDPNEIPSSRDLEYIVQYLRKIKSSKGIASFGTGKTWTVVASTGWSPARKASFLAWATTGLGFCLRPAGCGISYLLTTKERGLVVLDNLEKILSKLKSTSANGNKGTMNLEMDTENPNDSDQIPSDLRPSKNIKDLRKGKTKSDDKIPSFFPITSSNLMRYVLQFLISLVLT